GYFLLGGGGMSGGTRASAAGVLLEPTHAWRGGRIVAERGGARVRSFEVNGRDLQGLSVGSTEAFSLPRVHPTLRCVDTYLGWFGPATRAVAAFSLVGGLPLVRRALGAATGRLVKGSSGGPDAQAR